MSVSKSETDIILNKANIALARSQRLVASWLPIQTPADQSNAKPDQELQREEDEIFTAVPETLGLGAPLPTKAANGSWNRAEVDYNDALRRQLLGRNYKKIMAEKAHQKIVNTGPVSSVKSSLSKGTAEGNGGVDDDDEEDEGRTASIGRKNMSKKRKVDGNAEHKQGESVVDDESKNKEIKGEDEAKAATSQRGLKSKGRKKTTSFLDEILAERSKKRKKQ